MKDVASQLLPKAGDRSRAHDAEAVRFIPALMAPRAQQQPRFILGRFHQLGMPRLSEHGERTARRVPGLSEDAQWNKHKIVLRLAEHAADGLRSEERRVGKEWRSGWWSGQ